MKLKLVKPAAARFPAATGLLAAMAVLVNLPGAAKDATNRVFTSPSCPET